MIDVIDYLAMELLRIRYEIRKNEEAHKAGLNDVLKINERKFVKAISILKDGNKQGS